MRTDVKTLIAALTTERNSLDRAILALTQMSENGASKPVEKIVDVRPARSRRKTRILLSDEAKRDIVGAMATATNKRARAKSLARLWGGSYLTIYTNWMTWARTLDKQAAAVINAETTPETPELVALP